jgi:CDP-diacylglycerol--serine O-phosphatidyltransferase
MKIFRYLGPADYVTILNGLLGFLAIMYIIDNNFRIAFILILIIIVLDGFDGWLARYLKSKQILGKYLDSISDTVSFCFAPAVLIYTIFYDLNYTSFNYWPNALVVFVCFIIVGFGMVRLAWFVEYGQESKYFQGLPTPALALFVILLLQPFTQSNLNQTVTLIAILVITFLILADIKYPKFHDSFTAVFVGVIVLILIFALAFEPSSFLTNFIIILTLGLLMTYIILGPLVIEIKPKNIISKK